MSTPPDEIDCERDRDALVEQIVTEARNAGLPLRPSVEKDNSRPRALYERRGFGVVGEAEDEVQLELVSAASS